MLDQLFIQSSDPAVQPKAILQVENAIMEKPANTVILLSSWQTQQHTGFHVQKLNSVSLYITRCWDKLLNMLESMCFTNSLLRICI